MEAENTSTYLFCTSICTSTGEEFNLQFCVANFEKSLFFGLYNTL